MDFNGTWQVYAQENYEEFLKAMGEKPEFFGRAAGVYIQSPYLHVAGVNKNTCALQNSQQMSSRWPRTSSQSLRSSKLAMTLLSPPRLLEKPWPTPLPSARRLISPPWTARRSGFVTLFIFQAIFIFTTVLMNSNICANDDDDVFSPDPSTVHCQSGGRQTGLQNWQVLPHPRAQGRRDGRGTVHPSITHECIN